MNYILQTFQPRVGEPVLHQGRRCHIKAILDVSRCLLQPDEADARPLAADLVDLRPVPEAYPQQGSAAAQDPASLPDKGLAEAHRRLAIIRPLILASSRHEVEAVAREHGKDAATLYRWMREYRRSGMVTSLVPQYHRRGGPLKSRLDNQQEAIIRAAIEEFYLTKERPSVAETVREVKALCRRKEVKAPADTTVRNRILALSERLATRARLGRKSSERLLALRGSLPGADGPWSIVHMDHTKLDLIVVDRETRQPIARPWITLAEDAATRVVVGFHVSLDAPSALSVGLCLSNAILPKEVWLARRGVSGDWPVWGQPNVVHVDNAKEFHSRMLKRGCDEMGISIHYRRAGTPRDGGRMERLIGTLVRELHRLPGTTFSNPAERGEYDSEKEAAMTLDEVEKFIAEWIVNIYHQRSHRGLHGKSPIKAWEDGLLGNGGSLPGMGLPARHVDPEAVRLRFLPFEERAIRPGGIVMDYITYWSDHLRFWIEDRPQGSPQARKFVVRRDPRDITRVWLYDPALGEHLELSYKDASRPSMSLWELKAIQDQLRREGVTSVNEDLIFATRDRLRLLSEQARRDTKVARRERERAGRRREGATEHRPISAAASPKGAETTLPAVQANPPKPRRSALEMAFEDIDN